MDEEARQILERLVRVGVVTSVKQADHQVRVRFPDEDLVSGWLYVLRTASTVDAVWMPKVNDSVLCLYLPTFNSDGFVVGGIPE